MSIAIILQQMGNRLAGVTETPTLDAQVLLAEILGVSRTWLLTHADASLNLEQEQALQNALLRLEQGEALPYVIGHWEFYGLDYSINSNVLIPRPETELLVERSLHWLSTHPERRRAADIGTGSGCIAISLAINIPDLHVWASDVSLPALEVAKLNAHKHAVSDRVHFLHADLFDLEPLATALQSFDLIAANLPYIPTARLKDLDVARREPRLALDGGADGLDLIQRLIQAAPPWLAPGGLCILEIDIEHAEAALALAQGIFPKANVSIIPDLAGLDRLISIQLTSE